SRQWSRVIRRRHHSEAGESRIVVLVPDRNGNTARLATTTQQLTEFLARFCKSYQLAHVVDGGELRLLGEDRGLAKKNGIVSRLELTVEQLIALFDEDVQQIRGLARGADVAQPVAERRANLSQAESRQPIVENARHLGDGRVGDLATDIDEDRPHRARRQSEREQQSLR